MRYITLLLMFLLFSCSTPEAKWYLGVWQVSDAKFPGISAMGMDEATVWFGSEASYTETKVSFRDESCDNPKFTITSLTEDEFYSTYRARFKTLGIEGELVEILNVGCPSDWIAPGATLIKANNNSGYTLWDGVFFKVDKISS
jgi:hypothetical protein